jgi:hypothetical protein
MRHCRAPGVQHRGDADAGAEMLGVGSDCHHRLGRRLEHDVVDRCLVLIGEVGDWPRQREHDVEVGNRQQLGLAFGHPLLCRRALALGAVPVATGIVGDDGIGAVLAARDVPAQHRRAAALDRCHDLELPKTHVAGIGLPPCRPVVAEDIRDLQRRPQHARRMSTRCLNLLELDRDVLQRAHDCINGLGGHPRVERGILKLGMAEQYLNHPNVGVLFQ